MVADDSIEARCARIRGRMEWILSQLDEGGTAPPPKGGEAGGAPAAQRELEAQRRLLSAENELTLQRLRAAHASELAALRAELAGAREEARSSADVGALRAQLAAERKERAAAVAKAQEEMAAEQREASAREARLEAAKRKEAAAMRERIGVCERALALCRTALTEALPHLPPMGDSSRPINAALAAADAILAEATSSRSGSPSSVSSRDTAVVSMTPPPVPPRARETSPLVPSRQALEASTGSTRLAGAAASRPHVSSPLSAGIANLSGPPVVAGPKAVSFTPAGREEIPMAPLPAPPPSARARFRADHYAYSHPGGTKPLDAKNQDTYFVLQLDEYNIAWGVFDGHGGDNGTQVAHVASLCVRDFLAANWARLRPEPETAFKEAFQLAQVRIKEDLMATQPELIERDGVLYGKYIEEDGEEVEEAADGGTTATVICLLDGMALVHAQVGDSSALLGGLMDGEGGTESTYEELIREHSATHEGEYERIRATLNGERLQFVYDVADLIDQGKAPPIFARDSANGGYILDQGSLRIAEAHGTPAKNARGDLPAILLTPPAEDAEPQSLAMTRSLGDFYLQKFGVTCVPEVISVDLQVRDRPFLGT